MTTLTLHVSNPGILPSLKKVLSALDGVTIAETTRKKKSGLDKAQEDVEAGRLISYSNKEELFKDLGIC